MKWQVYSLFAVCIISVLDYCMWANWHHVAFEYSYFILEKGTFIWLTSILLQRRKLNSIDFESKIRVRRTLTGIILLFLIRIVWEIVSIIKGYDFMLLKEINSRYLILILCFSGFMIYWISRPVFWKPKE